MSINPSLSRTGWAAFGVVEIALFVIANVTATNGSHPGTVSNVFFVAFIVGLVLGVALGASALIRQRRRRTP
jgi:hypothetical protein